MRRTSLSCALALMLLPGALHAQFDQGFTKRLLEEYSLQLFGDNAAGFMGPLVIVSNVGANHGFFSSAYVRRDDGLHVAFSIQTIYTWVRSDERSYTGTIPTSVRPTDSDTLRLFKTLSLEPAVRDGKLNPRVTTATVFGTQGSWFRIPKEYLWFVPPEQLKLIPDSLQLTNGTNQSAVFAAVPQLAVGTWKYTDMLLRYIPPVTFDKNIGRFSFFGIALRHGVSDWFDDLPLDAAVQVSYQHSTIDNTVGVTKAKLSAATDMFSVNVHGSRRFDWFEPFVGVSFEALHSHGTYTFTLPANVVAQIGYDISPQVAHISLSDRAVKVTVGATAHAGPASIFASAGITKHVILGGGISYAFDPSF